MARRRTTFSSGPRAPKPPPPPPPPVIRRPAFEQLLCAAVRQKVHARIKYDGDWQFRVVAPHAVYTTKHDKVMLASLQISNPEKPQDDGEPREFEIGKIDSVELTDTSFKVDPRFDPFHEKYSFHVFCMIDR